MINQRFLILLYGDLDHKIQDNQRRKIFIQQWYHWIRTLAADSKFCGGSLIKTQGKKIYCKNKKMVSSAVQHNPLYGYFVIKARNLSDASKLAKKCPHFQINSKLQIHKMTDLKA